ncbi:MAG: DNA-3-methyladenine glycosylase 2 family protein [Verrucomicrobiota bacterium]|nr:DNA-3-methyladenine glycosylase 2 family protein [Verrucomicrobiota bacterium]
MTAEALQHLSGRCDIMRRLILAHGPCTLVPDARRSPFEALVRAVAHQQLNGTAAESILRRFRALFPARRFPNARELAAISDDALRGCGFSRAKTAALRDIAEKTLSGIIPTSRAIGRLSDDVIIERLTQVRGVGRWTVEMLLIFKLGRPDVLPADDFGVRNGFRIAFGLAELPRPKELLTYGERWRPHTTTAAWYLWRAADAAREKKPLAGVNA